MKFKYVIYVDYIIFSAENDGILIGEFIKLYIFI